MNEDTFHYQLRLAWSNVPYDQCRDELGEASFQSSLAYDANPLRQYLGQNGCDIILPSGPGAALGIIRPAAGRPKVIVNTFVPWAMLRPRQRNACHRIREALRCACLDRKRQLFIAARAGADRWR